MLWSFKHNGNGHHGYCNKNRAVKGLIMMVQMTARQLPVVGTPPFPAPLPFRGAASVYKILASLQYKVNETEAKGYLCM